MRALPLNAVAGWEAAILASIAGASGTPDARDAQIARSGLYGEYPAIVDAYLRLLGDPAAGLEALKRAVFLAWYAGVALPCDSAIRELPDHALRDTVHALEARLERGTVDDELRWMLAWYHARAPWLFELYAAGTAVADAVRGHAADAWRSAAITPAALRDRGQLGEYWRALVARDRSPGAR